MKTAVVGVLYVAAEPYLHDFFDTILTQDDSAFDLLLINDRVVHPERYFQNNPAQIPISVRDGRGTAVGLRHQGLSWALDEGYEQILFADCDDRFAPDRVRVSKAGLREADVVFNELVLFGPGIDKPTAFLSPRFSPGDRIRRQDLIHRNCLGLSNTGVRASVLSPIWKSIPDDLVAFDWPFFFHALGEDREAMFLDQGATYYRQYMTNTAPPLALTDPVILRGVRAKTKQYEYLASMGFSFGEMAHEYRKLLTALEGDSVYNVTYCQAVRKAVPPHPLWWEPMKLPEELSL